MTRKDYETIAAVIRHQISRAGILLTDCSVIEATAHYHAIEVLGNLSRDLAVEFEGHNANFDSSKFLQACGVEA